MTGKTLILLTESYPCGEHETFVEHEMKYLQFAFNKIYILVPGKSINFKRFIPSNVEVVYYNSELLTNTKSSVIRYIFSKYFISEISFIKSVLKLRLTLQVFKILLADLGKAFFLKKKIMQIINTNHLVKEELVIYAYWNDYSSSAIALVKEEFPAITAISRIHNWDIYRERMPAQYLPLKNFIFSKLDFVYFISQHGYNYINTLFNNKYQSKLVLAKLGIDNLNKVNFLNSQTNTLNLVSCSYFHPAKRIEVIVEMLSNITDCNIHWTHIGEGPSRLYIEELSAKLLSHKKNIKYAFLGMLTNVEVFDYYKTNQVDLFLNVSDYEGIPVSIMEAMSFGIPVAATDICGNSEIVKHNVNGILFPLATSPLDISKLISNFFKLPESVKLDYRQNAYYTWQNEYNAKKIILVL